MYISRFYASLALQELIDEVPIHVVASKYKVNRGILQCLQQSASLFAGIVTSFCNALNWELLGLLVSQFKDRLFFGVHQDLLDIMKIPIINSQRARALFKAGFRTLADLSNATLLSIEKCLYDSISFDTKKRDGESKYDEEQRNELRLVFITGKAGLTVPEAAKMIIEGARNYLQKEIGVSDVIWSHDSTSRNANIQQDQTGYATGKESCNPDRTTQKSSYIEPKSKKHVGSEMQNDKQNVANPFVDSKNSNQDDLINNSQLTIKILSRSLNDANIKHHATVDRTPITIIDVFQNAEFFQLFYKKIHVFVEGGFSLAINDIQSDERKMINYLLMNNDYLHGVSLCLGGKIVFYLNLQESGPKGINFTEKISFLREILMRSDFTFKILEAKEALKKILSCVPLFHVNCLLEDPKIAHWLSQSNIEPDFNEMVRILKMVTSI